MYKCEKERIQYEFLGVYLVLFVCFFYKNGYKNISYSTCFSRTWTLPHQEVASMSCTVETGWTLLHL